MPRIADRRAHIDLLRAAESVFSEFGLASAKVEDITARAGVSKGAFYLHFESKEDCFRQIVEGVLARLSACVKTPELETISSPNIASKLLEERHAASVEMLEFCWQNRGIMGMILGGGGGTPYAYLIDELSERLVEQSQGWLSRLVAVGVYRNDIDPWIVARLVGGTYERLVREVIRQPKRPNIEAWARQAQDLITRGLFSPEVSAIVDQKVTNDPSATPKRRGTTKAKTR